MSVEKGIVLVVEDELSEAVMRKVIAHRSSSLKVGTVITSGGFGNIKKGFGRFKTACRAVPHVVCTDLDQHASPCDLRSNWQIGELPATLMFSVAVRSIECWLLGDREAMADFLLVPRAKITHAPESLVDSKKELISLAKRCRSRRFTAEMCPEPGSLARQGPLYNAHMVRFVRDSWRVDAAEGASKSLARACRRIGELESLLSDG